MYDEYGEAIMDDDGYYYSGYGFEVILHILITVRSKVNKIYFSFKLIFYHLYEVSVRN